MKQTVAVLGAGSWGTALALQLARNQHDINLWGRNVEAVQAMCLRRENTRYLPGHKLPVNLVTEPDIGKALAQADFVVLAVPSEAIRDTLRRIATLPHKFQSIVWATKGLETGSSKFIHTIVEEELGKDHAMGVLSGPSFAAEVARGLPTAVTLACNQSALAAWVAGMFHSETFRVYTSDDLIGVQLGGAVKNVMAIAAGITDGLGFGANARAALITRGLSEIMRLGVVVGASRETLMGLSGLGDLILTCTDDQSRNRRLGLAIGRGESLQSALQSIGQVVEGVVAARQVRYLAQTLRVEMPITEQVCCVLYEDCDPREAVTTLLSREQKAEHL